MTNGASMSCRRNLTFHAVCDLMRRNGDRSPQQVKRQTRFAVAQRMIRLAVQLIVHRLLLRAAAKRVCADPRASHPLTLLLCVEPGTVNWWHPVTSNP